MGSKDIGDREIGREGGGGGECGREIERVKVCERESKKEFLFVPVFNDTTDQTVHFPLGLCQFV